MKKSMEKAYAKSFKKNEGGLVIMVGKGKMSKEKDDDDCKMKKGGKAKMKKGGKC